ncbi:MAG: thiamine diphosphokinase, partial [Calditrichaeota bacterium]
MKKGLVFANGEITEREIRRIRDLSFDVIIAADGGALKALRMGYPPHVVVGDLDSITPEFQEQYPDIRFIRKPSQELNDLEKTLMFCQSEGLTHLTLLGITGERVDHTLNNFSVLCRYDRFFHFTIQDRYGEIYLVRERWEYQGEPGQLISLIPLGEVKGVTTEGLA